nr:hypothetical protein [Tanacetum cinerariifolium]
RSSSNLFGESSPNLTSSNPKRHNRRRTKQPFILKDSLVDTMADQRTMAELLRATTKGYAEEIMVPLILAEKFELKHSLINMITSDQFFGLEKDNPHDHIRWGSPSLARKRTPRSILTWEDLVSKFINEFFPSSRTTNLPTPPPAFVKAIEEIYVTCGGTHPYYQCLVADGNTFPELWDNIQGYVSAAAVNDNQEEDKREEETLTDPKLDEFTIKVPPPLV